MTQTSNLGLYKPDSPNLVDVSVLNDNMDILDAGVTLNAVSYGAAQTLTSGQKTQARSNIGAVGSVNGITGDAITLATSDIASCAPVYTALADIGCSNASTLAQIAAAMTGSNATLVIRRCGNSVDSGTVFSNALPANYGTLRVYGMSNSSGVCHFEFYRFRTSGGYEAWNKNINTNSGTTVESGWAYENEYSVEALSLGVNWTANSAGKNQVSRQGNRCVLSISAKYSSAMSPSTAVTIATVSSDYRPSYTVYGILYGYHSSSPTIDRVTVGTDGKVQIQGTTAANTSITGMVVYDV